jgi:hypothetical protein
VHALDDELDAALALLERFPRKRGRTGERE